MSKNEMLNEQDVEQFKELFSKYCRGEINAGRCEADSCEFCSVNKAYNEIFDNYIDEDEEDDK